MKRSAYTEENRRVFHTSCRCEREARTGVACILCRSRSREIISASYSVLREPHRWLWFSAIHTHIKHHFCCFPGTQHAGDCVDGKLLKRSAKKNSTFEFPINMCVQFRESHSKNPEERKQLTFEAVSETRTVTQFGTQRRPEWVISSQEDVSSRTS